MEQAVSTEQKLLSQIQRLQDDRTELQTKVQSLAADKHGLQRKVSKIYYLFATNFKFKTNACHFTLLLFSGRLTPDLRIYFQLVYYQHEQNLKNVYLMKQV